MRIQIKDFYSIFQETETGEGVLIRGKLWNSGPIIEGLFKPDDNRKSEWFGEVTQVVTTATNESG